MKYIGAHVSAAGGLANAAIRAAEIDATRLPCSPKTNVSGVPHRSRRKPSMNSKPPVKISLHIGANSSPRQLSD